MHRVLRQLTLVSCLAWTAAVAPAQTKPTFEVASIKPTALDFARVIAAFQKGGEMPPLGQRVDGARAEYIYMALGDLISIAYKVKTYQIKGPDWMASQRFDIFAKLPDGASKKDVPAMLQALLEDRFKLTLHRESKEGPVLALVVGKGGPKMKESPEAPQPIDPDAPLAPGERQVDGANGPMRMTVDTKNGTSTMNMGANGTVISRFDPATRSMKIEAKQVTMAGLVDMLNIFSQAGPQVKDMTGLTRNYQVAMSFSFEPPTPGGAASDAGGSSSLVQAVQSMGLKLEPRKATVEELVIDHIEKTPTEN